MHIVVPERSRVHPNSKTSSLGGSDAAGQEREIRFERERKLEPSQHQRLQSKEHGTLIDRVTGQEQVHEQPRVRLTLNRSPRVRLTLHERALVQLALD